MLSMTAFATVVGQQGNLSWTWEVRSVNNRFLDVQCRLPDSIKPFESRVREMIRQQVSRGKVEVVLRLDQSQQATLPRINTETLFHLATLLEEVKAVIPQVSHVDPLAVLSQPNMLMMNGIADAILSESDVVTSFQTALTQFVTEKSREGRALQAVLQQRAESALALVVQLSSQLERIMTTHIDNLKQKVQAIAPDLEASRWVQEVAILAQRADVAEEIDRLQVHLRDLLNLLTTSEPVGRKLDFLMQELNREANTLGSKAVALEVTQVSLDLKLLIEQMREQIQNVE